MAVTPTMTTLLVVASRAGREKVDECRDGEDATAAAEAADDRPDDETEDRRRSEHQVNSRRWGAT